MNNLLTKISVGVALLFIGYFAGCYTNQCKLAHVVASEDTVKFSEEKLRDSGVVVVVVRDSGALSAKGITGTDGKKYFRRQLVTENSTINIEDTYDPEKETLTGKISLVVIKPVVYYFTSTLRKLEYTSIKYVTLPDDDDWTWVGVGAAIGSALITIAFFIGGIL